MIGRNFNPYPIAAVNSDGECIMAIRDNHEEYRFLEWQRRMGHKPDEDYWFVTGDAGAQLIQEAFAETAMGYALRKAAAI